MKKVSLLLCVSLCGLFPVMGGDRGFNGYNHLAGVLGVAKPKDSPVESWQVTSPKGGKGNFLSSLFGLLGSNKKKKPKIEMRSPAPKVQTPVTPPLTVSPSGSDALGMVKPPQQQQFSPLLASLAPRVSQTTPSRIIVVPDIGQEHQLGTPVKPLTQLTTVITSVGATSSVTPGSAVMTPAAAGHVVPAAFALQSTQSRCNGLGSPLNGSVVLIDSPSPLVVSSHGLVLTQSEGSLSVRSSYIDPTPVKMQQLVVASPVVAADVSSPALVVIQDLQVASAVTPIRRQPEERTTIDYSPVVVTPIKIEQTIKEETAVLLPVVAGDVSSPEEQRIPGMSRTQACGAMLAACGMGSLIVLLSVPSFRQRCGVLLSLFAKKNHTLWKTMQPAQRMRTIAVLAGLLASSTCVIGGSIAAIRD